MVLPKPQKNKSINSHILDGLQEPLTDNKNITSKSKIVDVDSGNTYYWRVKTTDTNLNSSYSQIFSFIVD